jgi:hypothetical protein
MRHKSSEVDESVEEGAPHRVLGGTGCGKEARAGKAAEVSTSKGLLS